MDQSVDVDVNPPLSFQPLSLRLPAEEALLDFSLRTSAGHGTLSGSIDTLRFRHHPGLTETLSETAALDVLVMNFSDELNSSAPKDVSSGNDLFYRHSILLTTFFIIAYLSVFAIGLVGNFLVVSVVFRAPRMRTVTNLFIANLAIADILVIVVCVPATLLSSIFVPWLLGWWMCKTVSYVQGVSVAASVFSLIAVSIDRFIAIWWPLKKQITKSRARYIIALIWVLACTATAPWAVYFDLIAMNGSDIYYCVEVWPKDLEVYGNLYYLFANLIMCYLLPLVIISLCYILIWVKVCRRNIPTDTKDGQMERIQQKSKMKVVKMLVVVVILFVLSWLPLYCIVTRIKLGGSWPYTPWEEEVFQSFVPVAQWMGLANSSINPILYAFFNKKYRRGFVAIIKSNKCCGRLHYYETVALMGSSSSMRNKSSYYINNNYSSKRRPPIKEGIATAAAVSFIFNNTGV